MHEFVCAWLAWYIQLNKKDKQSEYIWYEIESTKIGKQSKSREIDWSTFGRLILIILVKRPPTNMKSDNIEIKISSSKTIFECFPRIKIYALRPPILIYELITGT